ncbi:uncharacterized protein CPUR_05641 [Claviceps purpurea 20.1]|uniref:F-box domain-containing protein n=1 Tax=Claviceps purpurea (strain 20.1) TaxID=1111077 RepID=M1W2D7_CLAP2|nr:uncharacterized protein CPUR_05641 [Claviceps purpurea 20.1]
MDSAAPEASLTARRRDTDESRCPMALLPPETKIQIMSYISTQQSLSRLGQSCRAWYGPATEELYTRDAKEHTSFAIKWMAAHAVDEQTTASAIRTLEISRRWGGQINAVKWLLSQSKRERLNEDQIMYNTATALHFAVLLGNMRLTKTLLDMEASLTISCSPMLWRKMGSKQHFRLECFPHELKGCYVVRAFPIFLAFLQSDPDMCKLLIAHGAGREAMILDPNTNPKVMSILHFAAADRTTDYRQWQCLFDSFRDYIDEPCPTGTQSTPLHIALKSGCTQGMQVAVEAGADKEARNASSHTPLCVGFLEIPHDKHANSIMFAERTMCLQKFVELGASVDPEGESMLVLAVQYYASYYFHEPIMWYLISFLLEHDADIEGTSRLRKSNVVNEIIKCIIHYKHDPPTQELLKKLLSDLIDRGLNLAIPALRFLSPLCYVLHRGNAEPEWLLDFLCEKGATIHERELNPAFLRWCEIPRFWRTNQYNAWWQHQGQEDEIFQLWCEHPYNAWWWQHAKHISPDTVKGAYERASEENRQLYDILTHLPLSTPLDSL